jgi:hypothetical protein
MFIKPRTKTLQEKRTKKLIEQNVTLSDDLINTQEMAAFLFEENAEKNDAIIDLEEMIAELYERSVEQ